MQTLTRQPLTRLQLDLLKVFDQEMNETDILAIKQLLVQYFANKAIGLADDVWIKNNRAEDDGSGF